MVSIFLNATVLFLCLWWLAKCSKNNGTLVGISFAFMGGIFLSFVFALIEQNEYLDGLYYLFVATGSILLFFTISVIILFVQTHGELSSKVIPKILILAIPLVFTVLVYFWISNMTLKIGG